MITNNEDSDRNNQLLFILKQRQQEVAPLRYHSLPSPSILPHKNTELLSFEHSAVEYLNPTDQISFKKQTASSNNNTSQSKVIAKLLTKDSQKSQMKNKQQANKAFNASKKETFKYISPFILIAEQRAKERARKALVLRSRNATTQSWNDDTSAPSLFDPNLKKQELFKIQPRKPKVAIGANDSIDSITIDGRSSATIRNSSSDQKPPKLTIRSLGISPSRRTFSSPLSPAVEDVEQREFQLSSPPIMTSTGGERVSTATSPINYHSQPLMHGSKLIEPVVSRATSPMDNKVLEDIFGSADNETLHRGKNKVLEVENRIQEVDTAMHRQRLIDSLGSPIRLPEYRSPISTPANINESTSPFIAAMNANVDDALRELKETLASRVHPSAAAVKSHSAHRKRSVHTTPIENNFHHPIPNSTIITDQMMASMADLMKAVGGIISNSNYERDGSHSPHSHRRRRDRRSRSRSRSREHNSPVHQERLVSSRSQYAVSGCLHPMQVDEEQGQQPMLFTGPDAAHSIDKRKNTKPHLVVDISGNILNSEGDSPSSIFDAIIAKLQSIEESESEMLRYLAGSNNPGVHNSHSTDYRFTQETKFSDNDRTNITKLPGANSNFNRQRYVNDSVGKDHVRQLSSSSSIQWQDSAPSTATHAHAGIADLNDLVMGNPQEATTTTTTMDLQDTPKISSTHENALSNYMDTLSRGDVSSSSGGAEADGKSGGLGFLALLGVSTKVSRDKVHRQEQKERSREKELAYLGQFPRLKEADLDCGFSHDAILSYRNELARARQLKDVPFMSRGVTMSDVADSLGREITDQVMRVVCEEVDQYLNELTDSLVNRI